MESYLRKSQRVPIEDLFPDPNNPRLALEEAPGYADALKLFDEALRKMILEEIGGDAYGVDDLVHTIAELAFESIAIEQREKKLEVVRLGRGGAVLIRRRRLGACSASCRWRIHGSAINSVLRVSVRPAAI